MKAFSIFAMVSIAAACSSAAPSSSGGSADLHFHGEVAALPGLNADTGLQPPAQPVQVELTATGSGSITIDADAIATGALASPVVYAKAGSGKLALDAHVKLAGRLVSKLSGLPYDGPIPGMDDIDVAFGSQTTFDPFLLAGKATVTAHVPETALPPIPLGSIPGELDVTVTSDSVIGVEFSGVCAAASGDPNAHAQYIGQTTTSGTLVLKMTIVVHVPLLGDQTYAVPQPVSVPIPPIVSSIDLGSPSIAGIGDAPSPAGDHTTSATCATPPPVLDSGIAEASIPDANVDADAAAPIDAATVDASALCADGLCTASETAQTCSDDCGALWFSSGDARRTTTTGEWAPGQHKAECSAAQAMTGLSVNSVVYADTHAAICGHDDSAKFPHASCYALGFEGSDARSDYSLGDWAPGFFKGECAHGDYVAGVARDSGGRVDALLCCVGNGLTKKSCTGHDMHDGDDRESTVNGDWDAQYHKGECGPGRYIAGVAASKTRGTEGLLCCSP